MRATVIPDDVGAVLCFSEFGVFEPLVGPYEVLVILRHPLVRAQLAPLGRGTSSLRRRIGSSDLLDVLAPRLPSRQLASLAADVREALNQVRAASRTIADAYAAIAPIAHGEAGHPAHQATKVVRVERV